MASKAQIQGFGSVAFRVSRRPGYVRSTTACSGLATWNLKRALLICFCRKALMSGIGALGLRFKGFWLGVLRDEGLELKVASPC